jgi:hypothetical protein
MFEPTVQKLSAIHSISSTLAGGVLKEMLDDVIGGAKDIMVATDPYAVHEIAGQRAAIKVCQWLKGFLDKDIETLLQEYGLEEEDEDETKV